MAAIFLKSLIIGYSGAVMPGALLTYVMNQSMKKGAKVGYLTIIGHAILESALMVLIFLGLNKVLASAAMSIAVSFFGGGLLVYMGIMGIVEVFNGKLQVTIDTQAKTDSDGKIVLAGGLISLANPYFIIWWAGIGMVLLYEAYNLFGIAGAVAFGIGHFIADLSWYMFVSLVVSKTKGFLNIKVYRGAAFVLSTALVGFGIYYLISGFKFVGLL